RPRFPARAGQGSVAAGEAAAGADDPHRQRPADPADLCPARPGRRADEALDRAHGRPVRLAATDRGRGAGPARRNRPDARLQRNRTRDPPMTHRVRKAVFPVAGLGTRLLPATKTMPKEMVTIVDRPLIQYAVDEAREAGIEQMIFVTGRGKSSLVDYFDQAFELEAVMLERGKSLDVLAPSNARFGEVTTVRQQQPLGL